MRDARRQSRSPRRPCAAAPGTWASSCSTCTAAARPGASGMRTWTSIWPARPAGAGRAAAAPMPQRDDETRCPSSACAARSRRRCRKPSAASRTSPMSRKSTSPSWKHCAPSSTRSYGAERGKLTLLPFVARALVLAVRDFPQMNARFDDEAGVVTRYGAGAPGHRHPDRAGLMVPVVRHAETHDLWSSAAEIARLADAARDGKATREELSRLDHHHHQPRAAGRHRHHAGDQPSRSGDRRHQPDRRAAGDPRRRGGGAQDDEPVVARSTTAWSTAWTRRNSSRRSAACSKRRATAVRGAETDAVTSLTTLLVDRRRPGRLRGRDPRRPARHPTVLVEGESWAAPA